MGTGWLPASSLLPTAEGVEAAVAEFERRLAASKGSRAPFV